MRTLFARLQRRQSEAGGEEDGVIDQAAALPVSVWLLMACRGLEDPLHCGNQSGQVDLRGLCLKEMGGETLGSPAFSVTEHRCGNIAGTRSPPRSQNEPLDKNDSLHSSRILAPACADGCGVKQPAVRVKLKASSICLSSRLFEILLETREPRSLQHWEVALLQLQTAILTCHYLSPPSPLSQPNVTKQNLKYQNGIRSTGEMTWRKEAASELLSSEEEQTSCSPALLDSHHSR
ncbi:unnamed protein product [Leuciscus chuanchicus]